MDNGHSSYTDLATAGTNKDTERVSQLSGREILVTRSPLDYGGVQPFELQDQRMSLIGTRQSPFRAERGRQTI
jgi:hypothetical protein